MNWSLADLAEFICCEMLTSTLTSPVLIGGQFAMDGNKDAYFTETSDIAKYDSASQSFVQQGALIDLSGKSPNCHWDQQKGACA